MTSTARNSPASTPHPAGLATELRDGTRQAHQDAERGGSVRRLIRGELSRATYLDYLRGLQTIYAALESALARHADDPRIGPFFRPELLREPAITRDLAHLAAADLPPPAPAHAYARHIQAVAEHAPLLLIAHVYTRYLGDLSGGQLLRRGAARILGLTPPTAGLEYYDFPAIPDLDRYKGELRATLDGLPLRPDQVDAIVSEARRAFADSAALFAALT